ncbi:MAG: hypothetical protein EXQ88_02225 [Alphaproteobacteria bacterium]|nr:hypothetical protein [Alphaproteobacteria bacterium]
MAADPPAILEGYGPAGFRISGTVHRLGVLLLPGGAHPLNAGALDAIQPSDLAPLAAEAGAYDLLIVGCGAKALPAPSILRDACRSAKAALELLETGAACRTYGLLQSERRRVGALLFPL